MKLAFALAFCLISPLVGAVHAADGRTNALPRVFPLRGVVVELKGGGLTAVIRHEEVVDFMPAMTMSFTAKSTNELAGLEAGDQITCRLLVTEDQSWIDHVARTGRRAAQAQPPLSGRATLPRNPDSSPSRAVASPSAAPQSRPPMSSAGTAGIPAGIGPAPPSKPRHPLLDFKFTSELGAPVSFNDFRGQVIAYTFFFTRCPVPEYCPRLSRNFEEVSGKLAAMPGAPTNWRLISVSFDSEFDTPSVLKAYAQRYHYDSNHWTFLTGPKEQIGELARLSGANYRPDSGLFTHDFRTLIINPAGVLVMSYPVGGDLSDAIVGDILKAAGATNLPPPK
jgi:protein SCO1/2